MSPLWLGKWKGQISLRKVKHYHPEDRALTLPLPNGETVYLDKSLEEDLPECLRIEFDKVKGLGSKENPVSIIQLAMNTCLKRDRMALQKLGRRWIEGVQDKVKKDDDETELKGPERKQVISLIEVAMSVDLKTDPMALQKLGSFIEGNEDETNIKGTQGGNEKGSSIILDAMTADIKTDPMALQKIGRRYKEVLEDDE